MTGQATLASVERAREEVGGDLCRCQEEGRGTPSGETRWMALQRARGLGQLRAVSRFSRSAREG